MLDTAQQAQEKTAQDLKQAAATLSNPMMLEHSVNTETKEESEATQGTMIALTDIVIKGTTETQDMMEGLTGKGPDQVILSTGGMRNRGDMRSRGGGRMS